ncbi:MAG: fumarate hydratase C-terminal domain-containing protein [Vicinamibacteria bacterium]|nr:fumarate hydratase C-terminal domain-containing protein [Vicinamibacteria bacterium]
MDFVFEEMFQLGPDKTNYRRLTADHVEVARFKGQDMLEVAPAALTLLARDAFRDISFLLRASHQEKLARILRDPKATESDKVVARLMIENAVVSAGFQLPFCQDTGTATIVAKKGHRVLTDGFDVESLSRGVFETYRRENLRYSQMSPLSMYEERNTGDNLPAQIDIYAAHGASYEFLFIAKGGGSANKSFLFQQTRALLSPRILEDFLVEKMKLIGTAACPPYHLAVVIGGTSAEMTMKTVKLATAGALESLPASGSKGGRAFRDPELEERLLAASRAIGYGAQLGGRCFCHDVRVIRLPRHGASCPIGMGVSCAADRNAKAKITSEGVFLEELERDPGRFLEGVDASRFEAHAVKIDLNQPMRAILAELSKHSIKTLVSMTGRMIVARDIAHARLKERLDRGEDLPDYMKLHPVYYAGPSKTPAGMPSGSFGPTTAGRMDSYVDLFQSRRASMIMIAKGNRNRAVTDACKKHGGFYLCTVGGPAAILARDHIRKVELIEYDELGMEAVFAIDVVEFPAMIAVDDKGNDFFEEDAACAPESF